MPLMRPRTHKLEDCFGGFARLYPAISIKDVMSIPVITIIIKLTSEA